MIEHTITPQPDQENRHMNERYLHLSAEILALRDALELLLNTLFKGNREALLGVLEELAQDEERIELMEVFEDTLALIEQ